MNDTWMISRIALLVLCVSSAISCTKDIGELPAPVITVNNNPPDSIEPCDTAKYSYNNSIKGILNLNCSTVPGCHVSPSGINNVILDTYAGAVNAASGTGITSGNYLLCVIEWNCTAANVKMPFGQPQLPDSTINKIERWINSGKCE